MYHVLVTCSFTMYMLYWMVITGIVQILLYCILTNWANWSDTIDLSFLCLTRCMLLKKNWCVLNTNYTYLVFYFLIMDRLSRLNFQTGVKSLYAYIINFRSIRKLSSLCLQLNSDTKDPQWACNSWCKLYIKKSLIIFSAKIEMRILCKLGTN